MFFKREKIKSLEIEQRYKKKPVNSCEECRLYQNCTSPKMPPTGNNKKNIFFLAEAPGREEDLKNKQLIGESGQLLRSILEEFNFDLDEDALKDNSCRCRPTKDGQNRTPSNKEINCCRKNILKTIDDTKPNKIILLGKSALISFLGHRMNDIRTVNRWAGFSIPDQLHNCWVFPTFHPAALIHDPDNLALEKLFKKQLQNAIYHDKPLPTYKNNVIILDNLKDTLALLRAIKVINRPIVFDYETTGLKPHKKGHKILCMSISCEPFQAYAFPFYQDKKFLNLIKDILTNPKIGKIAHNFKFENTWTKFILGYDVVNWIADTMMTAHEIDNRTGITGLKFQSYVNYGELGYDNEVAPFIEADETGFNKLENFPIEKLLQYCGLDSLFTYLLWEDQNRIIQSWNHRRKKTHRLFLNTIKTFCEIEQNGFNIDPDYYRKQDKHLDKKLKYLDNKIQNSEEVKLFGKNLNVNSPKQMKKLLFNILKYPSNKITEKGEQSTDKDTLMDINTDFTNTILEYKKYFKIKNTYLAQFIREMIEDKLYPINNMNIARTYRTSNSAPNMQNIPIREEEAQKITRGGVISKKGHQILGVDYGALEVKMSACLHKDPVMLNYLNDPTTDMHRDISMILFKLTKEQMTKNIRKSGKGDFTFPQFYGAYYGSCAINLWKTVNQEKTAEDIPLRIHLADQGITIFDEFEGHVRAVEDDFWNHRFKIYTKWKKEIWNFYLKHGYIETLNGCRFTGLMQMNQVFDYPVQSIACHTLLYSMNTLHTYLKKEKMNSYILGQIHDEIIFSVDPNELNELIPIIKKVMCEDVKKYYDWIIVPLTIEATLTDINGNWYDKHEMKI